MKTNQKSQKLDALYVVEGEGEKATGQSAEKGSPRGH